MKLSQVLRYTDPPPALQPGVYVVRRFSDHACKIGMSEDAPARVRTIIAACGGEAELVHLVRTERPREAERVLHKALWAYRVEGEWFRLSPELEGWLKSFETWPREEK